MPSTVIFLNPEVDKKIRIFMAKNNIKVKTKAIEQMLDLIELESNDYDNFKGVKKNGSL